MKLKTLFVLTLAAALPVVAQDANPAPSETSATASTVSADASGIIEGRVSNMSDQKYLTNARVSIEGTIHEDLTDEFGSYRFSNLPAGTYTLVAFFTGLEPKTVTVTLNTSGERVVQDIELASRDLMDAMRAASEDGQGPRTREEEVVFLEKYSVVSNREMAGNVIATNEQRFATNIKSVIETDAFGDMNAGNVAEFLKYMPGVSVGYDGIEANSVSVRGFGSAFTQVTTDGAVMASADSGGDSRAFQFDQVSINEISLVEIAKVPLPSMSAGSLGGSVNLISKSAFESRRTTFKYSAGYSFNSKNLEFTRKTPGPMYEGTYKQLPTANFTLTMPVTRNFGLVIGGQVVNQYTEQSQSRTEWNFQENALDRPDLQKDPYLQSYQIQTRPKLIQRDSFSIRADWRVNRNHVFTASYRLGYSDSRSGKRNMNWDISEKSQFDDSGVYDTREWGHTPEWGYYTISPENYLDSKGAVKGENFTKQNVGGTRERGVSNSFNFKYRYTGNQWDFDAQAVYSISKRWQRDGDEGYFSNATTKIVNRYAGRVGFFNIDGSDAPTIRSFAVRSQEEIDAGFRFGEEIDIFDLKNYQINSVQLITFDTEDIAKNVQFNTKRVLGGLPYYASVKVGGDYYIKERDTTRNRMTTTFLPDSSWANGAYDNLIALGYKDASNYVDTAYSTVNAGYGLPTFDWISPKKLYQVYQQNPTWFAPSESQARDSARETYRGSKELSEAVTAFYFQLDGRFLQNRLVIATGVRWEMTDFRGRGVLETTEGETAADVYANWIMRGSHAHRSYNDFYPSLHVNYNITENFMTRFAYARTLGRPDFGEIIPNVKIKDKLDETGDGDPYTSKIEATNPELDPYTADNFDLTLEYYFPNGGEIRVAGFYKRIDGLFVNTVRRATMEDLVRLNVGSEYLRVPLHQKINLSDMTTVRGVELECRTSLGFLGNWGKSFTVAFNYTRGKLTGDYRADFGEFTEETGNIMLGYRISKLSLSLNCNYQGRKRGSALTDDPYQRDSEGSVDEVPFAGFYEYEAPTWRLEANMEYKFSKKLTFYITAKNINSPTRERQRYNSISAAYAPYAKSYSSEVYGTQFTFGVKGSF